MIDTKSINFFRLLFLLSHILFYLCFYFLVTNSLFLSFITMILALNLDRFVPDKYAIRYEKYWHVKESLFFNQVSGTTEKKIFIFLGIFIIGLIFLMNWSKRTMFMGIYSFWKFLNYFLLSNSTLCYRFFIFGYNIL